MSTFRIQDPPLHNVRTLQLLQNLHVVFSQEFLILFVPFHIFFPISLTLPLFNSLAKFTSPFSFGHSIHSVQEMRSVSFGCFVFRMVDVGGKRFFRVLILGVLIELLEEMFLLLALFFPFFGGHLVGLFLLQISFQCFFLELQEGFVVVLFLLVVLREVVEAFEVVVVAELVSWVLLPLQVFFLQVVPPHHVLPRDGYDRLLNLAVVCLEVDAFAHAAQFMSQPHNLLLVYVGLLLANFFFQPFVGGEDIVRSQNAHAKWKLYHRTPPNQPSVKQCKQIIRQSQAYSDQYSFLALDQSEPL